VTLQPPVPVTPQVTAAVVFTSTLEVWSRNLLRFGAVSLLVMGPLALGLMFAAPFLFDSWESPVRLLWIFLPFVLFQTGGLTHGVFQYRAGLPAGLGSMLAVGGVRALPVCGVAAVIGLVSVFAPPLFSLPLWVGVATVLVVALPPVVAERLGIVDALRTMARLTRGHRGSVFAAAIGTILVLALISGLVAEQLVPVVLKDAPRVGVAVAELLRLLAWPLPLLFPAVVYEELRLAREGS
jgi:hypothetical protein